MAWALFIFVLVINSFKGSNAQLPLWTSGDTTEVCESEASGNGIPVYTLSATDAKSYILVNDESVPFTMCGEDATSTDGHLCIDGELNRETAKRYELQVCASSTAKPDDFDSSHTNCKTLTVNIEDANDNAPQFLGLPYDYSLLEGNTTGTIFEVRAYDPDDGWNAIVNFALEGNGDGLFMVDNGTDRSGIYYTNVSLLGNLDFEESEIHIVEIVAADLGDAIPGPNRCGPIESKQSRTNFYLKVGDGPDTPPRFTKSEYLAIIQENSKEMTGDRSVSARDGDYGLDWVIKYSLFGGNNNFEIDETSGVISVTGDIDRESEEVIANGGYYTLTIMASEQEPSHTSDFSSFPGPQSGNVTITVTVEDVNDRVPTFYESSDYTSEVTEYNVTTPENTLSSISDLTIHVKDFDKGDNAKFELKLEGEDSSYFTISPTGTFSEVQAVLNVKNVTGLDYEVRQQLNFQIIAAETATADKFHKTVDVTIHLTDVNDNFPTFEDPDLEASIPEDAARNASVVLIDATDKDSGKFGDISFSLSPSDTFDIKQSGEVYLKASEVDREQREEYYLTIRAEDGGGLVGIAQLKVTVGDVNDEAPEFQQNQYSANWNENDADVTSITVYALDRDKDGTANSNITYQFENASLLVNYSITTTPEGYGEIRPVDFVNAEASTDDCEANGGVIISTMYVLAVDGGSPPLNASVPVTIYLQDMNDFEPVFEEDVYSGSIPEEAERNTPIANISASDGDKCSPNNVVTYAVDTDFSDKFSVTQPAGDIPYGSLVVRNSQLDRDDQDTYDVIVLAVDSGQPAKTGTATVHVTITDINNKSPYFEANGTSSAEISENAKINDEVAVVVAKDPDEDSDLFYTVERSDCVNEDQEIVWREQCDGLFNVSTKDQKGYIMVQKLLDREEVAKVTLTIKVEDRNRDEKSGPQTATWIIEITLDDYNDNPPKFTQSIYEFTVIEEVANDTLINQVSASDPDIGNNSKIVYSVNSPYVKINPNSGQLSVASRIDREGKPGDNFTVMVFATDEGTPSSLTGNCTVLFTVSDTNDNDPLFNGTSYDCSLTEEGKRDDVVCSIVATDSDIGNYGSISYSLVPDEPFSVDDSGEITAQKRLDRETVKQYQVKLIAEDEAGELSRKTEATLTISLMDIDDNDPSYEGIDIQSMSVKEDKTVGSPVGNVSAATDLDEFEKNNYYFLVYKSGDDRGVFVLDSFTGELETSRELDRETNASYTLYVLATKNKTIASDDYDSHPESSILEVDISVEDVNDNAPKFSRDVYTDDLQHDTQPNTETVITSVKAEDADEGINSQLQYIIQSQSYSLANAAATAVEIFTIEEDTGRIYLAKAHNQEVGGIYTLVIIVRDRGVPSLNDTTQVILRVVALDETVILTSTYPPDELDEQRDALEKELEDILNADVIIDKILEPDTTAAPAARAVSDEQSATSPKSEIYFHAVVWNSTELIPAEEVIDTLDNVANTQFLARYGIISVSTGETEVISDITETDLLKAVLVVICCLLVVIIVVYTTAFVCMRKSYRRKIKVSRAIEVAAEDTLRMNEGRDGLNVPGSNTVGQNPLYLENQKGNIDMDQLWKSGESNDDDNSIDDNEVDSQDYGYATVSDERHVEMYMDMNNDNDFVDVDIDFDENTASADAANLEAALNAARRNKGSEDIVLMFDNHAMEQTVM